MKATSSGLTLRLLATLLLAAGFAAAQEPPSCDQPEHRQLDFWLGAWEVMTPDGQLAGHNTIEKILNGCALEEPWRGAKGSIGNSLNMYFTRDGQWHQSWVDGAGGRLDLAGGLDGNGRMVLTGSMPGPKGRQGPTRDQLAERRGRNCQTTLANLEGRRRLLAGHFCRHLPPGRRLLDQHGWS